MESTVETHVESRSPAIAGGESALSIRMMGSLQVRRDGRPVELPPSRKVRALLAYLSLADHAIGRSRLCEVMGDVPSDPRGELRWYLSKLRSVLDSDGTRRVIAKDDMVSLDLSGATVDALEIESMVRTGLTNVDTDDLRAVLTLFVGDFLEGLDLNRSPQLDHWLTTRRNHFRSCHAAVLAELAGRLPVDDPETRQLCEAWVALAPFDVQSHLALMASLPQTEAERHLASAVRLFEAEGLDTSSLRVNGRTRRDVPATVPPQAAGSEEPVSPDLHRASLAVMPFQEPETDPLQAGIGAGLTRDIISRLAKLRALFIIAQGSVFALAERGIGPEDAGQRLNVDYVASGAVRRRSGRILVAVELVDARSARIVWSDEFEAAEDDAFDVLDRIGDTIVSSIASEVEIAEKNRAILKPPNSLNAWESFHRGLWHMHRFTKADNRQARDFFLRAVEADPTFARGYSGLSFTHWQNAFQGWEDRSSEIELAHAAARRSLLADDHDPSAHWAMGRALWLRREEAQATAELEQAVELSPNFALGHYALAFVHSQSGDPLTAITSADYSQRLSPFDPLLFGILGARAMAHVRLGNFAEAADWALKAAARPNAHVLIQQIAALCLALAGRDAEARTIAAAIRTTLPNCRVDDFLSSFKFPAETEAVFRRGAERIGLS